MKKFSHLLVLLSNEVQFTKHDFDSNAGFIFDELWEKGIDATERVSDIENGTDTNYELADAKQYLNTVLEEVKRISNKAEQGKSQSQLF